MKILRFVLPLLLLVPASNLYAQKTKVVIWHMWEKKIVEAVKEGLLPFQKANPDIDVEFVRQDNLDAKMSLIGKGDIDVDLIGHPHDQIGKYAQRGAIMPIDTLISSGTLKRISPPAIEGARMNGRLYGMPLWSETVALICNRKLVAAPPLSTEQVFRIGDSLKPKGIYPLVTIPSDPYFASCWVFGFGSRYMDANGNPAFNTDGFRGAVSLMRRFSSYCPKDMDYGMMLDLFCKGKAAMIITGPWSLGDIRASGIEYEIATLPVISGIEKSPLPFMGVQVLTMSKFTKKPAAAAKVMEYFASEKIGVQLALAAGAVPANLDALENAAVRKNRDTIAFAKQIAHAVPMPNIPEMGAYWQPLKNALYRSIIINEDCGKNADEAERTIKRDLERMRK